jgi:uncharacterized protein YegL
LSETSQLQEEVEFADNPEPRCPCVLLLDTSGSMAGPRIKALNEGLATFRGELQKDSLASRRIEIAIITFGSTVELIQDFITVDNFEAPHLSTFGQTHMAAGIERALDISNARKETYKRNGVSYYRPWVFMITDGQPEGESDDAVQRAAKRIREHESHKGVAFFAVGVEGANMEKLAQIAVRDPVKLKGLKFADMFVWLSASMQTVSHSDVNEVMVGLQPIGWGHVSQ